jgi:uncharacterized protein (UPF0276 family)
MLLGVGFRREMAGWIEAGQHGVDCLEITAEHFIGPAEKHIEQLARRLPLFVHGLGLSLGTPGPMDEKRVAAFARVVELANPRWVSEHVAFSRTAEVDLGHLNPVPLTREAMKTVADHAREVAERCGKPMLLENITSHLKLTGELTEPEFLNALCERADCGLLLDVTNLFINSRNHGFDPLAWLHEIEPRRIRQLHLVGYSKHGERYADSHAAPIQEELIELAQAVVAYAPVESVVLERDEDIPEVAGLEAEVAKLKRIAGRD